MEDFFAGVEQVDVDFDGEKGKLPVFYREARAFGVLLPAAILKLKRVLPDPRFIPAQVVPGIGVVALAALEYHDTDIGPYNEFAVAVLLNSPYYAGIPGYNPLRQAIDRLLHVYILRLPVTTEVAKSAGVGYYGFPKFIADIEFSDTDSQLKCDLAQDGERIMSVSVGKKSGWNLGEMMLLGNLYQYKRPQYAEIRGNVIEGAIGIGPGKASVDLNLFHPVGREVSELILSTQALGYLYVPSLQAILYDPSSYSAPLLRYALSTARLTD